jgi:hypothetical protein
MSTRRETKRLLKQLEVLTEGAILRWRIVDMIATLLLEKQERKIPYRMAFVRNKDLVRKIPKPTGVGNVVSMLLLSRPPILVPLDEEEDPPQTHFSIDGILVLKQEVEIWNEIFRLSNEYDLLKSLVQILGQRLDEVDRYIQGPDENEPEAEQSLIP